MKVIRPEGKAIFAFILNLSFISQFCVLVAAIVVSDMTDRLSPNIDPPTKEPSIKAIFMPPLFARPRAMGPRAVIVPTDEPVAIEIKQAIKKTPAVRNFGGTKDRPRPTTESTPPEALARLEKAPAKI